MADYSLTFRKVIRDLWRFTGIGIAATTLTGDSATVLVKAGAGTPTSTDPNGSMR